MKIEHCVSVLLSFELFVSFELVCLNCIACFVLVWFVLLVLFCFVLFCFVLPRSSVVVFFFFVFVCRFFLRARW